jgi:hypothetical protein
MICCIEWIVLDVEESFAKEGLQKLEAVQQHSHLQLDSYHHSSEDPNSPQPYMMKAGEKTKKKWVLMI